MITLPFLRTFTFARPLLFLASWALSSLLIPSPTANAFYYSECDGKPVKWRGIDFEERAIRMRISSISFPEGSGWTTALLDTVALWNRQPTMGRFITSRERIAARDNGENEVWVSDQSAFFNGSTAIAFLWYDWLDCERITEGDIVFDVNANHTASNRATDTVNYGGVKRSFQAVAAHEIGHILGLLHNADVMNIMGSDYLHVQTNDNRMVAHIGQDAAYGTEFLYGISEASLPDLSLHHVKYLGNPDADEYADHTGTRVSFPTEAPSEDRQVGFERVFKVRQGHRFEVEFTPDQNNKDSFQTEIALYLSTDRNITTEDREISRVPYWSLKYFPPHAERFPIQIPPDLTPGTYYVGAMIDPENRIKEMYEDNNATFALSSDREVLKVEVQGVRPPANLAQFYPGIGVELRSSYTNEGILQLQQFPEIRFTHGGFPNFPSVSCVTRMRLEKDGILENLYTTRPERHAAPDVWIPSSRQGTLSAGRYQWSAQTLCDSGRIVSRVTSLPLRAGSHFRVQAPSEFPAAVRSLPPSTPRRLTGVLYPQTGALPWIVLQGESFDPNGDDLEFRFKLQLVRGSSRSRDRVKVQALEQGVYRTEGPLAHPPLGSASLATPAHAIFRSEELVDGSYTWELCARDASRIWQCQAGHPLTVTP